jgi:hypothetical protein
METHVREFAKPAPLKLRFPLPNGSFEDKEYTYELYLSEFIWAFSKWNTEDGWDEAQIRIGDAIEGAAVGEMIKFETLEDFEKFREANKAADIRGPFAHKLRRMQKAGKDARAPKSQGTA